MPSRATRTALSAALLIFSSLTVAASPDQYDGPVEHARLVAARALDGELFHVQGLALTPRRIWITSVDRARSRGYLHEFDRATGTMLRRLELTDGARFHPGGISIDGGSIWVPVAEMRAHSSAMLVEIDADSLAVRRRIRVADHVGCVAASGRTLVAGNWDSERLYVIDLDDLSRTRAVPNPSRTHYQDMKFVDGQLVAGGNLSLWDGTIDWIDWPSMKVVRTRRAGAVGPIRPIGRGGPWSGEGMTIEGRDLYLLPEDGPSRLFRFRLDA